MICARVQHFGQKASSLGFWVEVKLTRDDWIFMYRDKFMNFIEHFLSRYKMIFRIDSKIRGMKN